jgi:UDP-N-acetylmuramate: L-alanyl-gamma-D-glutamyl-meso-diaminopimelate ligase
MGGLARLALAMGHEVSGCDQRIYPPMSTQLTELGIPVTEGYDPSKLPPATDLVVIGNALSRGNPIVEYVLEHGLAYTSGAQWVAEHLLYPQDRDVPGRWVLAVAGTHGKTTTASMLAWILEVAGLNPGFLIGGVPQNFSHSARYSDSRYFVIEADEYDTAFFDKRPKFLHYRPHTLVLNNLEYDHADIFPDLEAIRTQFHYLIRTVSSRGRIIVNRADENLTEVLQRGCWSEVTAVNTSRGWFYEGLSMDIGQFRILHDGKSQGVLAWDLIGAHNAVNALAAIAAADHAGVPVEQAIDALMSFKNTKRRMELRGIVKGISVYDDFAHHPTAISASLSALRARVGEARIHAVVELRSNSMRMGVHRQNLSKALESADRIYLLRPQQCHWNIEDTLRPLEGRATLHETVASILEHLTPLLRPGDQVLIMSNGSFDNIQERLLQRLAQELSDQSHPVAEGR